ncbi:TetR/AcrR family transcriptional regulator [Mangrovicoccus sp. HB161399]|uniref:TetR/AcrR family transcriptional regulator n=1 Tax=Mangrovicoccus sp. HB161399 TaxID=2720392 RepID=UPI0015556115|nr:TetR/AcrR family transcriptional regulator [Mangrovicoccus sp. HB161399]
MSTSSIADPGQPPRRGRPRKLTDDAQKARILEAAMTAFITRGFARTTMADVAASAGMSKRDLYRHFPEKSALFGAVIRARRHLILGLPRPEGEDLPPLDMLCCIFRLDLDTREAEERDALLNLLARESLLFPELNALLYEGGIIRSRELLMDWIAAEIARGRLPDCDPGCLAGLLMDVVFGALLPRRKRKEKPDRQRQSEEIRTRLAIVLRGIGADPAT